MRNRLYKYFTERGWADAFLDGQVLFRSLAYFRDYEEDENVRSDRNEGNAVFRPPSGLLITNQTQGTKFTLPGFSFESTANQEEIFVFCASRSLSDELRRRFEAAVCVEILRIPTLCERIKRALPDLIATSKFKSYQWQNEFRIIFCDTDALGFEKGATRLVRGVAKEAPKPAEHRKCLVKAGSLRDICRLHEF